MVTQEAHRTCHLLRKREAARGLHLSAGALPALPDWDANIEYLILQEYICRSYVLWSSTAVGSRGVQLEGQSRTS